MVVPRLGKLIVFLDNDRRRPSLSGFCCDATYFAALRHMGSTGRFAHQLGTACKIARNIDLSLLKTLKVGETPGFLWLSEFEGTGSNGQFPRQPLLRSRIVTI